MEELLPILIIAVALILRSRKANKEAEENEIPPIPPFPKVPMPEKPFEAPAPRDIAPQELPKNSSTTQKKRGASTEKSRNFAEKDAALLPASPAASARPRKQAPRPRPQGAPQKQQEQPGSPRLISLSTPEEARKAFIYSEIFQRKY